MDRRPDGKPYPPRRNATFSPYLPNGVIGVDDLLHLAQQMKEAGADTVKLGGEMHFVWPSLDKPDDLERLTGREANDFKADAVRPVKLCSAETFCRRFQQPVYDLARRLDETYRTRPLPGKLMIGVAGCQRSCSEPATKDIGIRARPDGYEILVGGSAGMKPKIAEPLCIVSTEQEVIETVGKIIDWYDRHGKRSQRLGKLLESKGIDELRACATLKG